VETGSARLLRRGFSGPGAEGSATGSGPPGRADRR
jgi:hypothetical protein